MQEREIKIANLLVEILLRWRVIVVAMLVGAVVMGGFSYMRSVRAIEAQKEQIAKLEQQNEEQKEQEMQSEHLEKQWLEEQLTDVQITNVTTVLANEAIYEERVAYNEQSVLMQIDALAAPKAEVTFRISTDEWENTYNIQKIYEDLVLDGEMLQWLVECEESLTTATVSELIALEKSSYNTQDGMDTIRVMVRHADYEICEKLAQAVVDYVVEKSIELQGALGEHTVEVLRQAISTITDTGLVTQQRSIASDIINLNASIVKSKSAFTDLELQYYNYLTIGRDSSDNSAMEKDDDAEVNEESADEENAVIEVNLEPGVSVKFVILGMLLGIFVYVFAIVVVYILNNKLRATDSLQEIYGMNQLGQVPCEQGKKKLFGFVDRWILALRDHNKRKFTEAEALALTTVAVRMAVGKAGADTVYVMGCDLKECSLRICEQMKKALQQDDIRVQILNNVLYDAQAMAQLENAKCAVLVEKAGSTLYNEVAQELELLKRQGIVVLGGILVE